MFEVEGDESMLMGMGFQASDVRKPLAAVHRIVEKGNKVQFGPGNEDNFIMNVKTGKKIMLRKKGRSYVMDVEFAKQARAAPFRGQPWNRNINREGAYDPVEREKCSARYVVRKRRDR